MGRRAAPGQDRTTAPGKADGWVRTCAAFEHASIAITLLDLAGRFLVTNEAFRRLLQRSSAELRRLGLHDLTHPDDRAATQANFAELTRGDRRAYDYEKRYLRSDGEAVWCQVSATSVHDDHGLLVGVLAHVQDIRSQRATRVRLHQTEQRLARIVETVPTGITVVDPRGRITFANTTAERLLRLRRTRQPGARGPYDRPAWHLELPDGGPAPAAALPWVQVARHRTSLHGCELVVVHPDGERMIVSVDAAPMMGPDEPCTGMVAALTDVTEQHHLRRQMERYAAEAAAAMDFFQDTLDSLPVNVAVLDDAGVIIAVNEQWRAFSRANGGGEHVGTSYLAVCDAADDPIADHVGDGLRALLAGAPGGLDVEYPCHSPAQRRWFHMNAVRFAGDGRGRLVVAHWDVTARRLAEDTARMHAGLLEQVDAAVIATDLDLRVTAWNQAAERLYGWTAEEAMGRHVIEMTMPPDTAQDGADVVATLRTRQPWSGETLLQNRDGHRFHARVSDAPICDADGELVGFVGVSLDVSDRVMAQQRLAATRDRLQAVTDSMGEALCTVDPTGRISYVNRAAVELFGTDPQDLLRTDLPSLFDNGAVEHVSFAMIGDAPAGFTLGDERVARPDGATVPVSLTATPLQDPGGGLGWVVVLRDISDRKAREAMLQQEVADLSLTAQLRQGMDDGRLALHAQPIVSLPTGAVVQHELLLRLVDPDGRPVPPTTLIPAVERTGFAPTLDRWVIDRSIELAATGMSVELNLCGGSLGDPDLVDHVADALHRTGTSPALLTFEVTETDLIANLSAAHDLLQQLRGLGCTTALDDFGSGYAGFTYLKTLPVDFLKIDREFVADLVDNPASRYVVGAVVNLAGNFGLQTVAEGVEDQATAALLADMGVDFAQGYLYGRPRPLADHENA